MTNEIEALKTALLEQANSLNGIEKLVCRERIATYCNILQAVHDITAGAVQSYSVAGASFSKTDLSTLQRLAQRYKADIEIMLGMDSPILFAGESWDY